MKKSKTQLWRTCRVISNESRLKLLWCLMQVREMSMSRLGQSAGLGMANASKHLCLLHSHGLIGAEQRIRHLFYSLEANIRVDHAGELLEALRVCYSNAVSHGQIIRLATAFTHPRRIAIVRALNGKELSSSALSIKTHISPESLSRHVKKLEKRGFVKKTGEMVCLLGHEMSFGQVLLNAALS